MEKQAKAKQSPARTQRKSQARTRTVSPTSPSYAQVAAGMGHTKQNGAQAAKWHGWVDYAAAADSAAEG